MAVPLAKRREALGQQLSGIITSFKYSGIRPNIVLVGNYHFLPIQPRYDRQYRDAIVEPYGRITIPARRDAKELSFSGACAIIQVDFHGGLGSQLGEVWIDGARVLGPLLSLHGYSPKLMDEYAANYPGTVQVGEAVNSCLKHIGIYCRDGMDEYDSAGLNRFDSNDDLSGCV